MRKPFLRERLPWVTYRSVGGGAEEEGEEAHDGQERLHGGFDALCFASDAYRYCEACTGDPFWRHDVLCNVAEADLSLSVA